MVQIIGSDGMRKRVLMILLFVFFVVFIVAGVYTVNLRKQPYISVENNMDKFIGGDEIETPSSHLKLYDTKIKYHVKSVKWDDNEKDGTAEVSFRTPDLEGLVRESLEHGEDTQKAVEYIDKQLEEGNYKTKEYNIEMDVVKENESIKIVVNEKMLEILNGCVDSILANTIDQEVEDEESF